MLRNKLDADDVTQEVLIRVWNNFEKFDPKAAKSWIMKTTHNLCLDYLRRRKLATEREYVIDEDSEERIQNNDRFSDPELETRREILKEKIHEAIERLPENFKSIFVMYELQGLKYKEISEILNLPLNSVRVYLLRARKKLQEELREFKHETTENY
jgi:RNA polymerase sigma-70 factor, ECF subfamily